MPVFELSDELLFPAASLAEDDGLLAVGGDLTPERLLLAYSMGIFPWYSEGSPILWWSPDPRIILGPALLRVSKSLKRVLKKGMFHITMDEAFDDVIWKCATVNRKDETGTWIVPDMIEAYRKLHRLGYAHSVEAWSSGRLVGGLYGVSLGRAFFGESMFHEVTDASKAALVYLVGVLKQWGFHFIDCQVATRHLESMGAEKIPRPVFLEMLGNALKHETITGKWCMPGNLRFLPV